MKKAFTLVELLGVIIVLAVIALITFPIIDNSIQKSRQSALERTIENIERAAYSYSVEYDLGYSAEQQVLELSELISKGFISKEEHINPVTDEELKGCVLYNWDETKKQYKFEYADPCEITETLPTMTLAYDNNYINGNGWINRNMMVSLNGTGSKFYYCLSDSECDPIIEENKPNGTKILTNEGTNVICAKAVNSHGESDVVCTEELKIDKTPPTIGSITVNGTKGSNDWYTTDVSINVTNGSDALSGHDKTVSSVTEINRNTQGTMVYVVTTDLAGNSATEAFNIKVDKDYPTLIAKSGDVTIMQGDSNPTINYFTYNYSISGGSISCEPSNTNSLEGGTKTITCTAIGGNGKKVSATKQIKVINDDISLAFEYVGNKTKPDKLPGKGEGYYVQSVSCQNGTAKWSNDLWALTNVETENTKMMTCNLTLGDSAVYDSTIDRSFENLKPENVVSGVQIGDVVGTSEKQKTLIAVVYVNRSNTYGNFYNGSSYVRVSATSQWGGAVSNTTGKTLVATSFIAMSDCGFKINGVQYVDMKGTGNFGVTSGNLDNLTLQNVSGITNALGNGENGTIYIYGEVR